MILRSIIFLLTMTSFLWAGFQPISFYKYVAPYKTWWGTTRHKVYEVPIWDESQARYWLGHHFIQETPGKGYSTSLSNGKEWLGIISFDDELRGMWINKSDGTYDAQAALAKANAAAPKLNGLRNIFVDELGNAYLQSIAGERIVSGVINNTSGLFGSWHSNSDPRNYVGITGIGDNGIHQPVTLTQTGWIHFWSKDLQQTDSVKMEGTPDITLDIIKSDGKLDENGIATFWVYSHRETLPSFTYGLYKVDVNPITRSIQTHFYPLQIPSNSDLPNGIDPLLPWNDFVPFYISNDDVRIVAIAGDHLHIFSSNGIWIESPWGTVHSASTDPWYESHPHGPLFNARTIMTTNNRKNWQGHQDIVIADDFEVLGHGLQRLTWTPDGFQDFLALDVRMKETALASTQLSNPVIQIRNLSQYRQLNDFKLRLWHSRQEGYPSEVQADRYYFAAESTEIISGCHDLNPNLCWTDVIFNPNYVIDPGQESPSDGIQFGIHYSDWKPWMRSNDYSWQGVTSTLDANSNLTVYLRRTSLNDWIKVWGTEPSPTSIPLPYGWQPGPPPVNMSEDLIRSMDDLQGWGCTGNGTCDLDAWYPAFGASSISITNGGWTMLESRPFSHTGSFSNIRLSIRQPIQHINPFWAGQVQVYLESRSKNLYNVWIGQASLTKITTGQWSDLEFEVPAWVTAKLIDTTPDLVVRISVNSPIGISVYSVDNLQLVP